jgi:hypothetical protein
MTKDENTVMYYSRYLKRWRSQISFVERVGRLNKDMSITVMLKIKFLSLPVIAASIIFANQATASVPDQVLNQSTNSLFWNVHPEMLDRTIQPNQTLYRKEWSAIREVMSKLLVWRELPQCYADPDTYGYDVENYAEMIAAVTDAVFYTRHPELQRRKLRPSETRLVEEWNAIYRSFPYSPC